MRIAVLVSAPVGPDPRRRVADGLSPRQDFLALADALDAELIAPIALSPKSGGRISALLRLLQSAWTAFRQRHRYDLIVTDLDRTGLILALLFKITGTRKGHVLICHGKIALQPDITLLKLFRLQTHIDRFVCYGPAVSRHLRDSLGLSPDRVVTVRHAADHRFWRPAPSAPERLIVSAGMFRRDYPTLVEAARGLDISFVIAASSPWVTKKGSGRGEDLQPNVRFTRCTYPELRELYARAHFVAIPLISSDAQSGSLVMYEAMAMGKAVVATRTEGQAALSILREGETGLYVPMGDVEGWRAVIRRLCDHPEEALAMGERARAAVEAGMNLDGYVEDMAALVQAVAVELGRQPSKRKGSAVT